MTTIVFLLIGFAGFCLGRRVESGPIAVRDYGRIPAGTMTVTLGGSFDDESPHARAARHFARLAGGKV